MTPLPRTPKPLPAGTRRMRQDNPIPMTPIQHLRWSRRRRPAPTLPLPTEEWMAAQFAHSKGRPQWGDMVEAAADGVGGDEVDAGYLAAIRLSARLVGTAAGQVPLLVADRLYDAGLIRRVAVKE